MAMLENLIKEYAEKGYHFAFRLSGNTEEAKDLVQEAFYERSPGRGLSSDG